MRNRAKILSSVGMYAWGEGISFKELLSAAEEYGKVALPKYGTRMHYIYEFIGRLEFGEAVALITVARSGGGWRP